MNEHQLQSQTVTDEADKTVVTVWAAARLVLQDGGDKSSTLQILFEINSSAYIWREFKWQRKVRDHCTMNPIQKKSLRN